MTALYVVAGLIALSLLVYLFVSLLKPEWFGPPSRCLPSARRLFQHQLDAPVTIKFIEKQVNCGSRRRRKGSRRHLEIAKGAEKATPT
jgi:K+-transporting ATPase KdpF subunit